MGGGLRGESRGERRRLTRYGTAGTVHGYGCEGEREPTAGRLPTAGQEGRVSFLILA